MTPDDFSEGVLRIFARELPQQIQIACHFESISPPNSGIRQNKNDSILLSQFCRAIYRTMTRRFFILAAILFAVQFPARADDALAKSAVLENDTFYLRVSEVGKNLPEEIQSAQSALSATNKIAGTVLDLRFADGDDLAAARSVADLFATKKLPLAILVNGETRGAAMTLAADLREAHDGLIFGSTAAELKPDIAVPVKTADEKMYFENPYAAPVQSETNSGAETNNFAPFIDHTSEADLVREKIKDGDQDEDSMPSRPTEPQKPFIHDPVLARAVDLIRALAIVRQSHA
jgi:hypothetical protein